MVPGSKIVAPQAILVVPLRYIGDTVLTVPLIRNLRQQFPEARIDVLTSATSASLLEPCPYVDCVLIEPKSTARKWSLLRAGRYDAVFILRKSATFPLLCALAGIPNRIGYDKQRFPFGYKRWGLFLSRAARYPSLRTEMPQAVSHLNLLASAGLPLGDSDLALWSTPEDEQHVDVLLQRAQVLPGTPLAILHATSASHGKQIALEKFIPALERLQGAGYTVICTGTPVDRPIYEALQQQTGVELLNLEGKTSLRQTFTLYRRSHIVLTVDSSPIHLAAAAAVPHVVGVFGPTNHRQWGPHNSKTTFYPVYVDLACRPCYPKVCAHNNCKEQLGAAQIEMAVSRCLMAIEDARA